MHLAVMKQPSAVVAQEKEGHTEIRSSLWAASKSFVVTSDH